MNSIYNGAGPCREETQEQHFAPKRKHSIHWSYGDETNKSCVSIQVLSRDSDVSSPVRRSWNRGPREVDTAPPFFLSNTVRTVMLWRILNV